MKFIKLFEDFSPTFVGYHCTDSIYDKYDGTISEDYFDRFEMILNAIKNKFEDAYTYIRAIEKNGIEYDSSLAEEIQKFFLQIGLKWIFVDEQSPLKKYGKYCHSIYFTNISDTISFQDFNEEDSDYSYVYLYFTGNEPIVRNIN